MRVTGLSGQSDPSSALHSADYAVRHGVASELIENGAPLTRPTAQEACGRKIT
jgi:hypothetical protein